MRWLLLAACAYTVHGLNVRDLYCQKSDFYDMLKGERLY